MKSPAPTTHDETLLAVAERRAEKWRVLLVRRGPRPTVLEAREFGASESGALSGWLDGKRCADLRVVLPASSTIVRLVSMSLGSPTQMLAAMRLQAEGMFLGSIPSVRLGLAVLDEGPIAEDAERQGVIFAWPEGQAGVEVPARLESITRYIPEAAAMLVLASGDTPAVSADRREGSIAIAMRGADGKLRLRATREAVGSDAGGFEGWNEGLRRAIVETALNAGYAPADIGRFTSLTDATTGAANGQLERDGDRVLMLDASVERTLRGQLDVSAVGSEPSWWRDWAVPLAAAIVATGRLSGLADLRRIAVDHAPSPIERVVARYSSPARALLVVGAAVLVLALAPVTVAWTRCAILEAKMPSKPGAFEKQQRDVEQRIALYGELSKRTIPIAKLLGDLACCTPDGIEVEMIHLSATQGLTLRGLAKAQGETGAEELVRTMASFMDTSGVFENTRWRFSVPDGRGLFKFDLESKVTRASMPARVEEARDWAVKTLSERKYGSPNAETETAGSGTAPSGTIASAGESDGSTPAGTPTRSAATPAAVTTPSGSEAAGSGSTAIASSGRGIGRRETPTGGTPAETPSGTAPAATDGTSPAAPARGASGTGAGGGPAAAARANLVIPDAISDEELKSMSKEALRGRLGELAKARNRDDIDPEIRTRLNDDFKRILDQLKALTP